MNILRIICGSDTINFDGTAGYHALWGKIDFGVSKVAVNKLGNQPVYEDVTVEMSFWVEDQGGVTAQVKLQTLTDVLEECARWGRRETGSTAGYIEYESSTSTISDPLRCEIMKLPDGWLDLPGSFDAVSHVTHIGDATDPIRVKFIRRGLWLDVLSPSAAGPSVAAANPSKMTVTWGTTARHSSPTNVLIDGLEQLSGIDAAYLVLARAAGDVVIVQGETATGGASQVDTTNLASGGSVRRVTGTSLSYASLVLTVTGLNPGRKVAVLGVLRNNSSLRTWKLYAELKDNDNRVMGQVRVKTIDTSSQNPRLHSFGTFIVPSRQTVSSLVVYVAPDSTSGSPTIDFDYFVLLMMDHPENRVLLINPSGANVNAFDSLTVKMNLFTIPDVTIETDGLVIDYLEWKGDAWMAFSGTSLTAVWMGPVSNYWVNWDAVSAATQLQLTATRTAGYLTPQ